MIFLKKSYIIFVNLSMKECQFCEEKIKDEAVKCQFCGEWLDDKTNEVVEISDRFARENKAREQGGIIGSYKIYFLYKLRYQTFDWKTRESRKGFWMFSLYYFLTVLIGTPLTLGLILIPLLALYLIHNCISLPIRRLHDCGRSGWWILIGIIPYLGQLILIIFFIQSGDFEENEYGSVPID
ncbi:DUF805 domain-containing protein [bacterium]|jgi:uncharacterized membrane protein YhaH (DUF805 family)|nr:DUF805 domain-containing protein [bacterium]